MRHVIGLFALVGCGAMSERVEDPAAGLNGSFEHARDGLPANWSVYTPDTVPSGDFTVSLDPDAHDGDQSIRFDVTACSPDGGRHSPGLFQEVPVGAGTYAVAFWAKSDGARWSHTVGSVSAKTGATTSADGAADGEWHRVEQAIVVPPQHDRLRIQLSVLSPGTVWFDDVTVQPM